MRLSIGVVYEWRRLKQSFNTLFSGNFFLLSAISMLILSSLVAFILSVLTSYDESIHNTYIGDIQFYLKQFSIFIATACTFLLFCMTLVYFRFVYFCFNVIKVFGEWVYSLYFIESNDDFKIRIKYERILKNKLKTRTAVCGIAQLICIAIYLLSVIKSDSKIDEITDAFMYSCFFVTIVTYSYYWVEFLVYRKMHPSPLLDRYLFSRYSFQRKLKPCFDLLFFFSFFGWIALPAFSVLFDLVSRFAFGFMSNLFSINTMIDAAHREAVGSVSMYSFIARIAELITPLTVTKMMHVNAGFYDYLRLVQNTFFIVVVVIQFVMIIMPLLAAFIIKKDDRKFFTFVLKSTIKTVVLLTVLQFYITKAFFVDTSSPLGLMTLFLFLLSYVVAHDVPDELVTAYRKSS